jgi:hypothetical protein
MVKTHKKIDLSLGPNKVAKNITELIEQVIKNKIKCDDNLTCYMCILVCFL